MVKITTTASIFYKGRLLLVLHKKLNKWMHVGGHVEDNEFFDEALKREIKEEVNLDVDIIDFVQSTFNNLDKSIVIQKLPFFIHGTIKNNKKDMALDYICIAKEPVNVKIKNDELKDFKWVTQEEIKHLDTFTLLKKLVNRAFLEYYNFIK